MSSEKALFGYLFSFPFPHFHDHWYALRGCRNTWWLTGGAPYGGGGVGGTLAILFNASFFFSSPGLHFFRQQPGPCWSCPSSDLRPGARLERPSGLNPSAPSHPQDGLTYLQQRLFGSACTSLTRWRP